MSQPKRALIVIDVQNDYFGDALPIEFPDPQRSLANIGTMMDAASSAGIPVIVVHNVLPKQSPIMAEGTIGCALHKSVASRPHDHFVIKNMPSAFTNTDLEEWLLDRAIDTLTVIGYMTHNCNLSTMLHAFHKGYTVEYINDASGSVSYENRAGQATAEEIHRVMCVVLHSRFAAVMSTEEWIAMLAAGTKPERDNIYHSNLRARRLAVSA